MLEWFKSLPKTTFVTLVITAGILYIVLSDPPKNLCDAQMDQFKKVNVGVLSLNPKLKTRKQTRFQELFEICQNTKTPGGCYELFAITKQILKNSRSVAPECYRKLANDSAFDNAIWSTLDLMVRMAWGAKAPTVPALKNGWFDPADLNLFCSLKNVSQNVYGKDRYETFQEKYFKELPEASQSSRNDVWARLLFSVNCSNY